MLEMLINPRKAERRPWELFFVGAFYAAISMLLVELIFSKDPVLSKYSGLLVVTFTVIFSMPFVYYTIRLEEKKITADRGTISLLKEHQKAIAVFMWLFLGFVVAFSLWYILFSSSQNFMAQIETYCLINKPGEYDKCVNKYSMKPDIPTTGFITNQEKLFLIFSNNIRVLVFTLFFSLLFGAGVIFILAWNASVIAAAIGIFSKSDITAWPLALFRYMIHGLPEIASYFIVALAGGLVSVAIIRHEVKTEKFWEVLEDSLSLILLAVIVLFIAAIIEVFITPTFF